jgi:hypothetical protein
MVKPIEVSKLEVEKTPDFLWNTFIDFIALLDYKDLTDIQMVASLVFKYDGEIQNGGHLQYFENISNSYPNKESLLLKATLDALETLGASLQKEILSSASKKYYSQERNHPKTAEDYSELATEDEFGKFDNDYYDCTPDVSSLLEAYLKANITEFVKTI